MLSTPDSYPRPNAILYPGLSPLNALLTARLSPSRGSPCPLLPTPNPNSNPRSLSPLHGSLHTQPTAHRSLWLHTPAARRGSSCKIAQSHMATEMHALRAASMHPPVMHPMRRGTWPRLQTSREELDDLRLECGEVAHTGARRGRGVRCGLAPW